MADESPGHRQWLREQLDAWVREGLISADQAAAISARYPPEPLAERSRTQRRIATIFGILGAVLIGLGVILFFAANWQRIPREAKFILILTATAAAYALGYWLRYRKGYAAAGTALLLLGGFLYGAGIFLVGQIFHVQAEPHYGLLLWAAGLLPLAYALPSLPLVTLGVLVTAAWVVFVSILGPGRYGAADPRFVFVNIVAAAVILYGVGRLHERTGLASLGRPHLITGGLLILATFLLYVNVPFEQFPPGSPLPRGLRMLQGGLAGAAVAVLAVAALAAPDRRRSLAEAGALVVLLLATWVVKDGGLVAVGLTLLYFAVCLGTVVLGVNRNDRALVNLGLVFFSIGIFKEYIEIAGRYLASSAFFIIGGVLLLAGGWFVERTRRRLLARMGLRTDET